MATASLGRLTLDLVAKIGNFTEPMTKAERHAKSSSNKIADSFGIASVAAKALGVAVAGISAGGVISFTNQTINAGNEIKKFSELANSSTRDFQYFAKGAETAGFSMEKFADVNKDVLDRLGEVSRGEGEMMDFFERIAPKIGVTAAQFKNLSGPEALQAYYNGLQKANLSHAEQVTYMEQLANDASMLIPLLKNGGEGFQKWGDAAERMNALMSDEMIANLALAKENVQLLNLQWEGAKNTLINGSMPAIQATIDNMDTLTNVTMIAGAYLASSYIPTLAIATKGLVTDTVAKISNIASTRAKTLADYDVTKANLAATAAMVKAMGVANAQTAAMMTNARAAYQQAAAAKATMFAGSGLLGVLGGPVGLGITVASVAAGYLLMRDNTEKATESLRANNESVEDAIKKYNELAASKRNAQLVSEKEELKKLGNAYDDSSDKLVTAAYALSRHNDMTAEQSKLVNGLIAEYKKTGDIDVFSQKINSLNFISQASKDRISTLGGSVKTAGDEFRTQKSFVEQMAPAVKSVGDQAAKTATEVVGLSEAIKKLLSENAVATQKNNLISSLIDDFKVDQKLAEMITEARQKAGILGTGKSLPNDVLKSVGALWNSEQVRNKSIEKGNELEAKRKKLIEAQGEAMKVNALVASNAAIANAEALEAAKNLPKGLLSAVNMVESPNSNNATSSAGAGGPMQFMPATADRYKVDIKSVESSYRGASEYLKRLLEMFDGDLENALRAYNWGEGNMQNYLKYGSGMKGREKGYFPDRPMPKETREYSGKVMGFMGGVSGVSFTEGYSYDDWLKEQEKFSIERERREKEQAAKQLDLTNAVATEKVRINTKLAQDIKSIEEAGFPESESKKLIAEYQRRADIDIQIADAAQIDKLSSFSDYTKSEEQLLNESYARRQRDLKLDISLTIGAYTEASAHIEKQRVMELSALQISQQWQLLEAQSSYLKEADYLRARYALEVSEIEKVRDAKIRAGLLQSHGIASSDEFYSKRDQAWNNYQDVDAKMTDTVQYRNLDGEYSAQRDAIDKAKAWELISEEEHKQSLLDLDERFLQERAKLNLSYGEDIFGSSTEIMKNAFGEQSGLYKTMFATQKAFAIAQSLISIQQGLANAASNPWPTNLAAMASVAAATSSIISNISSVAGVFHGGTDYVPKESSYLLDKGERVLSPRQNKDLTSFLEGRGNLSNSGTTVNVNHDPSLAVTTRDDGNGNIDVYVRKIVEDSWNQLSRPNSKQSKLMGQNFNAPRRR